MAKSKKVVKRSASKELVVTEPQNDAAELRVVGEGALYSAAETLGLIEDMAHIAHDACEDCKTDALRRIAMLASLLGDRVGAALAAFDID